MLKDQLNNKFNTVFYNKNSKKNWLNVLLNQK